MINQTYVQQEKDINQLFESLKKGNGTVQVDQLYDLIQDTEIAEGCSIVIKKLQKIRGQEINLKQFQLIFSTDINRGDNLKFLFELLDKDNNQLLTLDEILNCNKQYDLKNSQEDLRNMYNYICTQKNVKSLNYEDFRDAMTNDIV